jgi:hypothetical protein
MPLILTHLALTNLALFLMLFFNFQLPLTLCASYPMHRFKAWETALLEGVLPELGALKALGAMD